jgi:uncharacterized membrane protein
MTLHNTVFSILKRHFVSGVLVVVPLILTYLVLKFLFETVDGILQPILHTAFGYYVPGLGVVTTILVIILAGFFTRNIVGARLYRLGDRVLVRMPIIRPIYSAAKQLLEAVALPTTQSFKEVALVEYPRRGVWALCFIANQVRVGTDESSRESVSVFVPSTPTPISGIVIIVPAEEVLRVAMTVEEGVKFLVSGGVASPSTIALRPNNLAVENREVVK